MMLKLILSLSLVLLLLPGAVASICPPGKFSNEGRCIPCPVGTYNEEQNRTSCDKCGAGTYNRFKGASSYLQCTECPYDTYSGEGAAECKRCPEGTFSRKKYSQCLTCPPGKHLPDYDPYEGKCTLCPPAFYRPAGPPHTCLLCPSGTGSRRGATECFKCPKGTYRDTQFISLKEMVGCRSCRKNQFADVEGSVQCKLCPLGSVAADKGATKCTSCPAGTFRSKIRVRECRPCQKGTTSKGMMPAGCKHPTKGCPVNTFEDRFGECRACMPGERLNLAKQKCVPCGNNQVSLGGIATECKTCPPGQRPANANTIFEKSRCECLDGTETDGVGCRKCPKGTHWSNKPGGSIRFTNTRESFYREAGCQACEAGFFADEEGLSKCKLCPVGTYTNVEGRTRCIRCPKGYISRAGNPLDDVSGEDSSAARDDCISERSGCGLGEDPNKRDGNGECTLTGPCPPNTFRTKYFCDTCWFEQFYDPNKGCRDCPRGSTTLGRGTPRSCKVCPKGASSVFEGSCVCTGAFGDDGEGGCKRCPEGEVSVSGRCAPCGEDSVFKAKKRGSYCIQCTGNKIKLREGDRRCTKCREGFKKEKDVFGREVNGCVPKGLYRHK